MSINDKLLAFYQLNGAVSDNINQAEVEFLEWMGVEPGHVDDMWFEYLTLLGHTGSLNDMETAYWCDRAGAVDQNLNDCKYAGANGVPIPDVVSFITTWRTTAPLETIVLPLSTAGDLRIDWGDGTVDENVTATSPSHEYADIGDYDVQIRGTFGRWHHNNAGDKLKIIELKQWGNFRFNIQSPSNVFYGCSNLIVSATDPLVAPDIISFTGLFRSCTLVNPPDVSNWDIPALTSMNRVFQSSAFEGNGLDAWDVSLTSSSTAFALSAGITTAQYDELLIAWGAQTVTSGNDINFGTTKYTPGGLAEAGRDSLVAQGWIISDGGPVV